MDGGWSAWSAWSPCSSECNSGVQTRERFCTSPPPQHGGRSCPGPHIQTADCNAHPCSGMMLPCSKSSIEPCCGAWGSRSSLMSFLLHAGHCPEGMMYMTAGQCEDHGGPCPRVCMDMTSAEVQCATACYDGCYCALGLYLLNGSCVPLSQCPCYHRGEQYPAGATLPVDACNNWYSSNAATAKCDIDSVD